MNQVIELLERIIEPIVSFFPFIKKDKNWRTFFSIFILSVSFMFYFFVAVAPKGEEFELYSIKLTEYAIQGEKIDDVYGLLIDLINAMYDVDTAYIAFSDAAKEKQLIQDEYISPVLEKIEQAESKLRIAKLYLEEVRFGDEVLDRHSGEFLEDLNQVEEFLSAERTWMEMIESRSAEEYSTDAIADSFLEHISTRNTIYSDFIPSLYLKTSNFNNDSSNYVDKLLVEAEYKLDSVKKFAFLRFLYRVSIVFNSVFLFFFIRKSWQVRQKERAKEEKKKAKEAKAASKKKTKKDDVSTIES